MTYIICVVNPICVKNQKLRAKHSTAQHNTAQHSTTQQSTAQHSSAVQCSSNKKQIIYFN